jgi:hypothetical protein
LGIEQLVEEPSNCVSILHHACSQAGPPLVGEVDRAAVVRLDLS